MTLGEIVQILKLDGEPQRVLVVEDHVPLLLRLEEFCAEMGHPVVAMAGINEIEGSIATGLDASLDAMLSVNLATIDVAFVDHYFLSRRHNGATVTRELTKLGRAKVFGMSSDAAANAAMAREGATLTLQKAEFMRLIGRV